MYVYRVVVASPEGCGYRIGPCWSRDVDIAHVLMNHVLAQLPADTTFWLDAPTAVSNAPSVRLCTQDYGMQYVHMIHLPIRHLDCRTPLLNVGLCCGLLPYIIVKLIFSLACIMVNHVHPCHWATSLHYWVKHLKI
jgi:hypothetical protein